MIEWNKEKLVYRILAGKTKIKIEDRTYFVRSPNVYQRYLGEEFYEEVIQEHSAELMTEENLLDWMMEHDYWSVEEDEKIKKYKKDIEDFQVTAFEMFFRSEERRRIKKMIGEARDKLKTLTNKRAAFDHLCISGFALIERNKFLIGLGLSDAQGKPLFNEDNYLNFTFLDFDRLVVEYNKVSVTIPQYREIARTEPWRQYWSAREGVASIFDSPATDLTEEQLSLMSWTRLYDSIFQHPKCPSDEILEDDDCMDGFLIKDKREREKEKGEMEAEELIQNPKIKNAQEIYIVAETPEDLKRINNLNPESIKATKRQRDAHIDKHGKVKEAELPDVKRRLMMEIEAAKTMGSE